MEDKKTFKYNCKDCGNVFWTDKIDFKNPAECPKCKSKNTIPWMDKVVLKSE